MRRGLPARAQIGCGLGVSKVLRASTEDGVAEALGAAKAVRLSGGGTCARPAPEGAVSLSLAGLTGIVEHRPTDLVATVRAGTTLTDLAEALAPYGQRFPLEPPDPDGTGTLGGVFATGADGLLGTRGWRARDILLGARAVLPNSDRVRVGSSVVKSVSGFDVCKALVGSRGTLAAITEVTFRVEALPAAAASLVLDCETDEQAHAACAAADALALAPRGIVVVREAEGNPARVLVRLEGPSTAVEAATARLADAGFSRADADDDPFPSVLPPLLAIDPALLWSGPCSRVAPLGSCPAAGRSVVADVSRGRIVCAVATPMERPAESPLWIAVRQAFDPDGVLVAGRGAGAP